MNLKALVTGGGQRVGAAIAMALGEAGYHVAVHFNGSREGAERTVQTIVSRGGKACLAQADLGNRQAARDLIQQVTSPSMLGGLDLLVPSAANFERVQVDKIDEGHWDRALALNTTAPWLLCQAATPFLTAAKGSIVFVTCTSTTRPYRHYLPYVVSKAATKQLMKTLSLELAPHVRVNAVAPGTVLPPEDMPQSTIDALIKKIPLGRVGTAQDIAQAVLYLASAPFVTGHELVVDGGHTVGVY